MWEREHVADVIVVSGPPGAGKSTVAGLLAEQYEPSALVVGDTFFSFLARGVIDPWLPEADAQNRVVLEAAAAACGRLARRCTVVYDGVLWPPYLDLFTRAAGRPIHYAILLPPLEVCLERVRTRAQHPFTDEAATVQMWRSFAAETASSHTLTTAGSPADVARQVAELVAAGTILAL